MKKLTTVAFAAASLITMVTPAYANGNSPRGTMGWDAGPWYGGTGCRNLIPILNRWFPTLGCTSTTN